MGEEKRGRKRREEKQQHRLTTSLCEEKEETRHCVCVTPLNGKNLDDAQRPLQAKLW